MASISVNNITNANVYMGSSNLLGKAESVDIGNIKTKLEEIKALGMVGTFKLPAGFEIVEGSIKWNSFYSEHASALRNPFAVVNLQVRANVQVNNSQGVVKEKALVTLLTVRFTESPLGKFEQHKNAEFESKFEVQYIKQLEDGVELFEFDVFNNIFKVDGVDLLATYKANIGG